MALDTPSNKVSSRASLAPLVLFASLATVGACAGASSVSVDDTEPSPAPQLELVEHLAIGDEAGAEQYLFGSISAAWATTDRIYVVDQQVPAVRAYGVDGEHIFDIGRPGQGPGEFSVPAGLAVTNDGRVAIADLMNARINFYDADGTFLEDWPLASPKSAQDISLTYDGELLTESWDQTVERMGMQRAGPEGPAGETLFPPIIEFDSPALDVGGGTELILPFAPTSSWVYTPAGEFVVGAGDRYVIQVQAPDGTTHELRRDAPRTAVEREEAAFRAELATAALQFLRPDTSVSAGDLPDQKPFFTALHADRAGRVWVARPGPARPDPLCEDIGAAAMPRLRVAVGENSTYEMDGKPAPLDMARYEGRCISDSLSFDLFDVRSGDFLGTADAPETGFKMPLYADGSVVLAAVADAGGIVRLKVYRLASN